VILVAEDDEDILALVSVSLGREYDVLMARDGREALQMALERHPDLAVVDLKLPRMDGAEVVREIRASEGRRAFGERIQVLLMSAYAHPPDDRAEWPAPGADDFLSKPFRPGELRERAEALLRWR
jgi:two-component system KDP operon response regulator KdpE